MTTKFGEATKAGKSEFLEVPFKALGFTSENWEDLKKQIIRKLPYSKSVSKGNKGFGEKFEVSMRINGKSGASAQVLTAWVIDGKTGELRLVTAYQDKKGNKNG